MVFSNSFELKFIDTSSSSSHFTPCESSTSSWVDESISRKKPGFQKQEAQKM